MSYVTVADVRKHIGLIHNADDDLIQDYIDAAEDYAAEYMGRPGIYDEQNWKTTGDGSSSSTSSEELVPPAVVQAIKIIACEFYERRAQAVVGTIYSKIEAAENMLHLYRIGLGV